MDEGIELKPCPFCGSSGVVVVGSFVRCGNCGAVGPYGYTDLEAIERWNVRAVDASARTRAQTAALRGESAIDTG